jgi:hypothetical protein
MLAFPGIQDSRDEGVIDVARTVTLYVTYSQRSMVAICARLFAGTADGAGH